MFDGDVVFGAVADRSCSQGLLGPAARLGGPEHTLSRLCGSEGDLALAVEVRDVRFFLVSYSHQRRRKARDLRLFGYDQRDRLAAEHDLVVVKRPKGRASLRRHLILMGAIGVRHLRSVLVGEHVDHAGDAARLARIDLQDAALGDAGSNDAAVGETWAKGEAGFVELSGVFRRAGDLRPTVDA